MHMVQYRWFASASKMVILGIVPENPIDMRRNSILNPYVKAFVSEEREKPPPPPPPHTTLYCLIAMTVQIQIALEWGKIIQLFMIVSFIKTQSMRF